MMELVIMRNLMPVKSLPKIEFPDVIPDAKLSNFNYYSILHYPLVSDTNRSVDKDRKWMEENYAFGGVIARSYKFFLPKNCFWTGNLASQK